MLLTISNTLSMSSSSPASRRLYSAISSLSRCYQGITNSKCKDQEQEARVLHPWLPLPLPRRPLEGLLLMEPLPTNLTSQPLEGTMLCPLLRRCSDGVVKRVVNGLSGIDRFLVMYGTCSSSTLGFDCENVNQ